MEIVRAEKMGFCFGVQEAIKTAEEVAEEYKGKKIYILGMLVHNKEVIKELSDKGIEIIEEENIDKLSSENIVIVRAHGARRDIYDKLNKSGAKIFDAACVFVKKSRNLILEKEKEGKKIIFVGDREHPEVIGIISYAENVEVVANIDELKKVKIESDKGYFLLAQTTLNKNSFEEIKNYLKENHENVEIAGTICGATYERQIAVEKLARAVDVVLVVGGYNSSNSKKLYGIAKAINERSYQIETKDDLKKEWIGSSDIVGITAGASTPEKSIVEIEKLLKEERRDGKHGKF